MKSAFFRIALTGLIVLASCSPNAVLKKQLNQSESKYKDHIGFMVYDPQSGKTLIDFNSGKYFTPASNTKIFTFYTSLQILGDSIPALKYVTAGDSLIFWGTGDPSFLYRMSCNNNRVFDLLRSGPEKIFFSTSNFKTTHFGPGWAWDDYSFTYSSERTSFPVYGNYMEVAGGADRRLHTCPALFEKELMYGDSASGKSTITRDFASNRILFNPGKDNRNKWQIPFHSSPEIVAQLLSDTLKRRVQLINQPLPKVFSTLKSIPADSLYSRMMQVSDNFIAEQLLLLCSDVVSDTLDPDVIIRYAKKNFLFDLPDDPVWIDGSGLSRYNLFTPRSLVRLWEKIYRKVPQERLFRLLASGSQRGTLRNWYIDDKPYVYGKTGFLSNNHALSGYLITRKGKVLIFSFMNGNFIASLDDIRGMMQEVLMKVRNKY